MADKAAGRRTARKTTRKASEIPTGTVTFLFTDIEGSTAMWEDHPEQMQNALTRHDEILHAAVEARGGYVFKMIGDACCAAFATARQALEAILAAQRALFAERWEEGTTIRVRMALHTGVAEERDGDYFGPPVNRVARLLSAGHGGQMLLSAVTYGLVRDVLRHMEPGAELRDLGEHRLRDLRYTERLYHLVVPDLPSEFPPPKGEPLTTAGKIPSPEQRTPDPKEKSVVADLSSPAAQSKQRGESGVVPPREDRYTRKMLIGSGGMAEVYLAHDNILDRDVALKVLRRQYADDEQFVERFRREARNAASLSHPNIVAVHDTGEAEDGAYYIVMEYVPGGTLQERVLREGSLPSHTAAVVALQVAKALEAAHRRGVIHRDIKPQNVLLTEEGEAKVGDFGIARAASSSTITKTGAVLGTAHYLSPEQALGQPASPRSDLYSLGVVLYEMLTGELPHDAETPTGIAMRHLSGRLRAPQEINPNVPEGINAVTVQLLARDPQERYGSATELMEDLERVLRGEQPTLGAPQAAAVPPARSPSGAPPSAGRSRGQGLPSEAPTVPQVVRPASAPDGGRRRVLPWVVGGGLVVVVALVITAWLLPNLQGGETALKVPSLEGQKLSAVRQEVGDDFQLVSSEKSSTQPKDTIISQEPDSGALASRGSTISVVVSTGVPSNTGDTAEDASRSEEGLVQAVEDYYEAVDREDWPYTYNHLDAQAKSMFTEEEWYEKNQYFADTEDLELSSMDVRVNGSASDPVVSVTVDRTFKNGYSLSRTTYFVYEDGAWKHRLSQEEKDIFMPGTPYDEFVAAQ